MIYLGTIAIDAAITETHSFSGEITQFPVESGATIIDHKRINPITLSLECVVSDAPLGPIKQIRDNETAGQLPSVFVLAQLEELHKSAQPFDVTTSLRVYKNMQFTSIEVTREATSGKALAFTASLQQFDIVTVQRIQVLNARKGGQRGGKAPLVYYGAERTTEPDGTTSLTYIYDKGPKANPRYVTADGKPFPIDENGRPLTLYNNKTRQVKQVVLDKKGFYKDPYYTPKGRIVPKWYPLPKR